MRKKCMECKDEINYSGYYSQNNEQLYYFCSVECLVANLKLFNRDTFIHEFRVCSECNSVMESGFVIGDGQYYYCTDECLDKNLTKEEYLEMYDDGEGDSYWTEWEFTTPGMMMKCFSL